MFIAQVIGASVDMEAYAYIACAISNRQERKSPWLKRNKFRTVVT